MKKYWIGSLAVLALCVGITGVLSLTGCEDADGMSYLLVEPAFVELTPGSNIVEFVISTNTPLGSLALPLEWKTTQTHMGQMVGAGGLRAVYVRFTPNGENTIIVRDQYGNEGYATVRQIVEQYGLTLELEPSSIPEGARHVSVRVTGSDEASASAGRAPFTWRVVFPERGVIEAGQGTDTIIFRSYAASVNIIQCTDALGVTGTILVEFTDES